MTTKGLSYKQIIIPIESNNSTKFIESLSEHIANINYTLKGVKSNTFVDFKPLWSHYFGKQSCYFFQSLCSQELHQKYLFCGFE